MESRKTAAKNPNLRCVVIRVPLKLAEIIVHLQSYQKKSIKAKIPD
ncbi:hypothetical protein LJC36_02625 [Desulfovibrio sp. OttesenSCG-928-C14]|nr:hypothetical protein [Desulfovibrio sp. OttesenSCG-928-C14]